MEGWIAQLTKDLVGRARDGEHVLSRSKRGYLEAELTEEKKVQILEFNDVQKPLDGNVMVSDSYTKVRAKFSRESTNAFRQKHKRQFSHSTVGGFIVISSCTITFVPATKSFMLMIHKFNYCGEEGSETFGRPVAIETDVDLQSLFAEVLLNMRDEMNTLSPFMSQAGSVSEASSVHDDELATQEAFSTQAPYEQAHGTKRAGLDRRQHSDLKRNVSALSSSHQASSKSVVESTKLALLGLLGAQSANAEKAPERGASYLDRTLGLRESLNGITESISSQIQQAPSSIIPLQASGAYDIDRNTPPSCSCPKSNAQLSHTCQVPEIEWNKVDESNKSPKLDEADYILGVSGVHHHSEKGHNKQDLKPAFCGRKLQHTASSTKLQALSEVQYGMSPWEGLPRIPRKQTHIPKDQRAILDREDSWYSSISVHGREYANLPPKLAVELKSFFGKALLMEPYGEEGSAFVESFEDDHSASDSNGGSSIEECDDNPVPAKKSLDPLSFNISDDIPTETLDNSRQDSQDSDDAGTQESDSDCRKSWSLSPSESERMRSSRSKIEAAKLVTSSAVIQHGLVLDTEPTMAVEALPVVETFVQDQENSDEAHGPLSPRSVNVVFSGRKHGKYNSINSGPIPPSSVADESEMEIAVPYTVDDVLEFSEGTDVPKSSVPLRYFVVQVEGTPRGNGENTHDDNIQSQSSSSRQVATGEFVQQPVIVSSSPIIPATFKNNLPEYAALSVKRPAQDHWSSHCQTVEENEPASSFPTKPFNSSSHVLNASIEDDYADLLADQQICADYERYSQEVGNCVPLNSPEMSLPVEFGHSQNNSMEDEGDASALPLFGKLVYPASFGSQGFSTSLEMHTSGKGDQGRPANRSLKRSAQKSADTYTTPTKRLRSSKCIDFGFTQIEPAMIDPGEMVKANRRKFIEDHSPKNDKLGVENESIEEESVRQANAEYGNQSCATTPSKCSDTNLLESSSTSLDDSGGRHRTPISRLEKQLVAPSDLVHDDPDSYANGGMEEVLKYGCNNMKASCSNTKFGKVGDMGTVAPVADKHDFTAEELLVLAPRHDAERVTRNVFERFYLAYPEYSKNLRSFIGACVYIEWLVSTSNAPHPFLWDDFIRAFSSEFRDYTHECKRSNQKPLSGVKFYDAKIQSPLFTKQVMNLATLNEALLLDVVEAATIRAAYQRKDADVRLTSLLSSSSLTRVRRAEELLVPHGGSSEVQPPQLTGAFQAEQWDSNDVRPRSESGSFVSLSSGAKMTKRNFETPNPYDMQTPGNKISSISATSPPSQYRGTGDTDVRVEESHEDRSCHSSLTKVLYTALNRSNSKKLRQFFPQSPPSMNGKISLQGNQEAGTLESTHLDDTPSNVRKLSTKAKSLSNRSGRKASPILGRTIVDTSLISASPSSKFHTPQAEMAFRTPSLVEYRSPERKTVSTPGSSSSGVMHPERRTGGKYHYPTDPKSDSKIKLYQEAARAYISRRKRESL